MDLLEGESSYFTHAVWSNFGGFFLSFSLDLGNGLGWIFGEIFSQFFLFSLLEIFGMHILEKKIFCP
jgi:hypothetical protein